MTHEPVRWGLMGTARIATVRVLPVLPQVPDATLLAVASRSMEKARRIADQFGAPRAYDSYEALLADPDIEVVYIPLPNHLHKEWAIKAVQAGKHVLCEKPIALNAAEAREMQAAARANGRLLLEAFMYRFGPLMQKALEIVRSGVLGDLRAIHTAFDYVIVENPANVRLHPEMGGGALYDIGAYCINVARMLAGREPVTAFAHLERSPKWGVDMSATGVLDFGDGLLGTFSASFDCRGSTFFRAVGTRGVLEAPEGFLGRGESARLMLTLEDRSHETVIPLVDAYALELQDMCDAVRGVRPAQFVDEPLDATIRVIDACFASERSGRPERI
jgi:xylose dehydrogenase (NAD/NADP)